MTDNPQRPRGFGTALPVRRLGILVCMLLVASMSTMAEAGSAFGRITKFFSYEWPSSPPLFFINLEGTATSPAGCATATASENRWVIRTDTAAGKAHLITILVAKQMGKSIRIEGKEEVFGTPCDLWSNTESVRVVEVPD